MFLFLQYVRTLNTVKSKPNRTPVTILNSKNRDGCPIWFRLYGMFNMEESERPDAAIQ